MTTVDDLQEMRWHAIDASIDYDPSHAIPKYWLAHPELGSPISPEIGLDDGSVGQAFANGVLTWNPVDGLVSAQ